MPQNRKEALIFALTMCTIMCAIMSSYRMLLSSGSWSVTPWFFAFIKALPYGLLLSQLIARPIVTALLKHFQIMRRFPEQARYIRSFTMSACMATGMVFFGFWLRGAAMTLPAFATSWLMSYVMSAPLSCFLVNPFAQKVLGWYRDMSHT